MWNVKYFVIPKVTWAMRTLTQGLIKYLETIPGKHSVHSLQKIVAILGTLHMKRKVLQSETSSLSGGVHH
jgi:hypothetical protein